MGPEWKRGTVWSRVEWGTEEGGGTEWGKVLGGGGGGRGVLDGEPEGGKVVLNCGGWGLSGMWH